MGWLEGVEARAKNWPPLKEQDHDDLVDLCGQMQMDNRKLIAAVRLAEDKVDVIRLLLSRGCRARAGKEVRDLLAHVRSGEVE